MPDVYLSGSIHDPAAKQAIRALHSLGYNVVHDWSLYTGPKRGPEAASEAQEQFRAVVEDAAYVIVMLHPRLKAGWIELGAALASGSHVIVVQHPEVGDSMWFEHPAVTEVPDLRTALAVIGEPCLA